MLEKSWSGITQINTQTIMLKMNAGEQSFNHMPYTIDCIHDLLAQIA